MTEKFPSSYMSKTNKVILYHAYGIPYLYWQVIFSILTLYYHLSGNFEGIRIVIYTDNEDIFSNYRRQLPISIESLTKEKIQIYKGKGNFVHRVKLCIIQDCFRKYSTDILYLDSDTYFCRPPLELLKTIGPGTSVMNSNDYDLTDADKLFKNDDWLLIQDAIKSYTYNIENINCSIPLTTRMWNAGVIGIGLQNKDLLQKMLELTDQIYSNIRVFTAEQFAVSYYLQKETNLVSSGETIFHYWQYFEPFNYRAKYNYQFNRFFKHYINTPIEEQALQAFKLTLQHERLPLPPQNWFKRIRNKINQFSTRFVGTVRLT